MDLIGLAFDRIGQRGCLRGYDSGRFESSQLYPASLYRIDRMETTSLHFLSVQLPTYHIFDLHPGDSPAAGSRLGEEDRLSFG